MSILEPTTAACPFSWCEGHDEWESVTQTGDPLRTHSISGDDIFTKSGGMLSVYAGRDEVRKVDGTEYGPLRLIIDVVSGAIIDVDDIRRFADILATFADKVEAVTR